VPGLTTDLKSPYYWVAFGLAQMMFVPLRLWWFDQSFAWAVERTLIVLPLHALLFIGGVYLATKLMSLRCGSLGHGGGNGKPRNSPQ
jgi:hypothetical protein